MCFTLFDVNVAIGLVLKSIASLLHLMLLLYLILGFKLKNEMRMQTMNKSGGGRERKKVKKNTENNLIVTKYKKKYKSKIPSAAFSTKLKCDLANEITVGWYH